MSTKVTTSAAVATLLVSVLGIVGYIMNIIDIFHTANNPVTGMFILRCIGIVVFPVGAVLGYF